MAKLRNIYFLSALLSFFSLIGCKSFYQKTLDIERLAMTYGFKKELVRGGDFLLTTYSKLANNYDAIVVYIEGDGNILQGGLPSVNPTPREPMVLKLAFQDPRPNILYIARPCQYIEMSHNSKCVPSYWLRERWSESTIAAIREAIVNITNQKQLHLVGFSGGGGIAILLATRMPQVASILTIAGNLDLVAFNKYHHTRLDSTALNPLDYAAQVKYIPQLHLSGLQDTRVPSSIAENFIRKSNSRCVHGIKIKGVSHNKGWLERWQQLLNLPINCQKL